MISEELQLNTKEAIEQMIYLDKTLAVYNDRINKSDNRNMRKQAIEHNAAVYDTYTAAFTWRKNDE